MVRSVLQLHKDEMQAHIEPSTTPHFTRGDKVSVVIETFFYVDNQTGNSETDSLDLL
jgi:hypothetical protein